jgi:hypothetical protein
MVRPKTVFMTRERLVMTITGGIRMKAINNRLPLRKVLIGSLITAQLLSTQLIGSYALAAKPAAPAPGAATAQTAAPANVAAAADTQTVAQADTQAKPADANVRNVIGIPINGKPKFNVTDGDQTYVAEAEVISSETTNSRYGYKDGQYVIIQDPTQKTYSAKISLYDTEGNFICASGEECGLSTPDVTNQLHDLNSAITSTIQKDLAAISKKRKDDKKKKEKEDKLLESCKAIRGDDGEIIKITAKNRMEHFEEVLDCQVSRVTEDKDEDKNDEDLTVKELRSKEIGGLLRRAMVDEDSEVRGQAQEAIEDLEVEFGDTSRNVRAYLKVLGDGAEQMDRLYDLKDQADANPQARAQILAEMDRAVGAWNPQNYAGKTKGYTEAASDVHKLFKAISCDTLSTAMASNRTPTSGGQTGATCDSDLDKAIGDGYTESFTRSGSDEDDVTRPSDGLRRIDGSNSNPGSVSGSGNNGRLQRVSTNTNTNFTNVNNGAIFNQNQRTPMQLANPNQFNGGNQQPNNNGRGPRF